MIRNHYGIKVNSEKPVTGVFDNNEIEWLSDEMYRSDAIDLAWEEHLEECDKDDHDDCGLQEQGTILIGSWIKHLLKVQDKRDGKIYEVYGEFGSDDPKEEPFYDICPHDGIWQLPKKHTKIVRDGTSGRYAPDPKGEYSAIVCGTITQVLRSKWGIKGNLCSPCYPGQAESSKGDQVMYSVPPDLLGDRHERIKDVFKLDGKEG